MKMYKVRIKKAPDSMAYGGQKNYALDLSQRGGYADMTDSPYESVSNTLQSVDRRDANVEAELGETAYGDFNNDGHNEHMNIGGEKHSQGGTPLNVPEGTFIYSDTKKLRIGGPVLAQFGKSPDTKQKYTPAQLAKQYNVNKYRAILDNPNADKLSKETAGMMVNNFEKKLGGLALLQESMKGFPQGIPDVAMSVLPQGMGEQMAKMGGFYGDDYSYMQGGSYLPKMQMAGTTPQKVKKEEIAKYEAQGYKKVEGTNTWRLPGSSGRESKDVIITPGSPGTGPVTKVIPGKKYVPNENDWWRSLTPEQKAAHNIKKRKEIEESDEYKDKTIVTPGTPGTPETKTCPDGPNGEKNYYTPDPNDPTKCIRSFETPPKEITYDEIPVGKVPPGEIPPPQTPGRRPYFGKQFMVPPKRYTPYAAPLNAMIPEPTFYDPNRELAEGASNRNMMAAYMQQMDPQQFSARANALNAQGAEQAANTIGRYQNMNVGVANQFSPLQTDIMNKVMGYRADAADKLVFNSQQEDKAYRNAMRMDLRNRDMYDINEYDRATKQGMLNETNPYYSIQDGPKGATLNWKDKTNWMNMVTGQTSQPSEQNLNSMQAYALQLKNDGHDAATINQLMRVKFPNSFQSGRSAGNAAAINAQYMNMNRAPMAQSAYPFGYEDDLGY
jgi:hypothetical protein